MRVMKPTSSLQLLGSFNTPYRLYTSRRFTITSFQPTRFFNTSSALLDPISQSRPICVAMSGGVDSAVAAALLLKAGHRLRAVFVKCWADESDDPSFRNVLKSGCQWRRDWADVKAVCRQLNIPCELLDLSKAYWNEVWEPCLRIWEAGGTPNPDVLCNRHIKFGLLAHHVLKADPHTFLATGHYARLTLTHGRTQLWQAQEKSKDQSYYLATTPVHTLQRVIFPLGGDGITKSTVRAIARDHGLINAHKPESMGICLVEPTTNRFENFLATQIDDSPGQIRLLEDPDVCLGEHRGLWYYTIGQRCRIPSTLSSRQRMYVAKKDARTNRILVVPHHDHPALWFKTLETIDFSWLNAPPSGLLSDQGRGVDMSARVRTGTLEPIPCRVLNRGSKEGARLTIQLETAEHGVATGQVVVLMLGTEVLGGGTISDANH